MCKRLFVLVLLLVAVPSVFGEPIGVFNFSQDVGTPGNPSGTGGTRYVATNEYLILGGGSDIWEQADHFHYAYNEVSGNVRFELSPAWDLGGGSDWAKIETMLRANIGAGSVTYATATRRGNTDPANKMVDSWVGLQARSVENDWMWGTGDRGGQPSKIAIQRVVSNDYQLVQSLVDYGGGAGWEAVSTQWVPSLPDQVLMGAAVTSHDNNWLVQARVGNVAYTQNPGLVGITQIRDPLPETCGDIPGLKIEAMKTGEWSDLGGDYATGFARAETLITTRELDGDPGREYGSRIDPVVNLLDSGGTFNFPDDKKFPGIDDDGIDDDDDQFGVLVTGCIQLTQGLHVIGGQMDDGVKIWIGGVEIGATSSWNQVGLFPFNALADGIYSFKAVGFEWGGGADLELYEALADGSLVLLGTGPSAVYCVPEPATIALLGFGGLAMLRVRRKR
jgi:hypothetical protein